MGISPAYSIHRYRDDIYKVVAFKGNRDPDVMYVRDREDQQHNDIKLDSNFSRARSMVLQYALCNTWDYFFTGTLDPNKFDRYDLDSYAPRLMQFIRDKRKKYKAKFQVLLIPEHHENGAWHIHGLIHGLPDTVLRKFRPPEPYYLVNSDYMNWPDYMDTFGFCSLGPIRDSVATAFYITKYVSKDLSRRAGELGKHLYFHSRPLRKAEKSSDVYLYNKQLEDYCDHDHDFCKTGMVEDQHWYFPYIWDGADYTINDLDPAPLPSSFPHFKPWEIDSSYVQGKIPGF